MNCTKCTPFPHWPSIMWVGSNFWLLLGMFTVTVRSQHWKSSQRESCQIGHKLFLPISPRIINFITSFIDKFTLQLVSLNIPRTSLLTILYGIRYLAGQLACYFSLLRKNYLLRLPPCSTGSRLERKLERHFVWGFQEMRWNRLKHRSKLDSHFTFIALKISHSNERSSFQTWSNNHVISLPEWHVDWQVLRGVAEWS
jgi:hypothetical protein